MNEIKFVQVPVEPTDEMLQAGWEEHEGSVEGMYAAMLSAAPKQVSQPAPAFSAQVLDMLETAAGMLMAYSDSVKEHGVEQIERWHYIPDIEDVAEKLHYMSRATQP